ncbi:hypothetical protein ACFPRL_18555 [Pseudoclavibacter helvolus]
MIGAVQLGPLIVWHELKTTVEFVSEWGRCRCVGLSELPARRLDCRDH